MQMIELLGSFNDQITLNKKSRTRLTKIQLVVFMNVSPLDSAIVKAIYYTGGIELSIGEKIMEALQYMRLDLRFDHIYIDISAAGKKRCYQVFVEISQRRQKWSFKKNMEGIFTFKVGVLVVRDDSEDTEIQRLPAAINLRVLRIWVEVPGSIVAW